MGCSQQFYVRRHCTSRRQGRDGESSLKLYRRGALSAFLWLTRSGAEWRAGERRREGGREGGSEADGNPRFRWKKRVHRGVFPGSILPVSIFGIKTRSCTMRTRPNMKMLACLGTYFALLAYEVAFDKHCVRLFNSRKLEAQQAYSNRPGRRRENEAGGVRQKNGNGKR